MSIKNDINIPLIPMYELPELQSVRKSRFTAAPNSSPIVAFWASIAPHRSSLYIASRMPSDLTPGTEEFEKELQSIKKIRCNFELLYLPDGAISNPSSKGTRTFSLQAPGMVKRDPRTLGLYAEQVQRILNKEKQTGLWMTHVDPKFVMSQKGTMEYSKESSTRLVEIRKDQSQALDPKEDKKRPPTYQTSLHVLGPISLVTHEMAKGLKLKLDGLFNYPQTLQVASCVARAFNNLDPSCLGLGKNDKALWSLTSATNDIQTKFILQKSSGLPNIKLAQAFTEALTETLSQEVNLSKWKARLNADSEDIELVDIDTQAELDDCFSDSSDSD